MKPVSIVALCALAGPALAEPLPFNPDRPGFSDSPGVAPQWHVITEVGTTLVFPEGGTALTVPDALVRLGLVESLELRLVLPTYNRFAPDSGDAIDGFGDLGVGAKFAFVAGPLAFGLVGTVILPTGSDDYTSDAVNAALGLNWGVSLSDRLSLGGVLGADLSEDAAGDRVIGTFGSLSIGAAVGAAGLYVEAFATRPDGGPVAPAINLGSSYAITDSGQIDATFTVGLDDGPDNGLNVGTSWLW